MLDAVGVGRKLEVRNCKNSRKFSVMLLLQAIAVTNKLLLSLLF